MNLIGSISFIDSVADFGTSPELNGAFDVELQQINGIDYVYVSGNSDSGVQVLSIDGDGLLTPVSSFADNADTALFSVQYLETIQVGDEFFLAASSGSEDGISIFRLDDDGEGTDGDLVFVASYFNSGDGENNDGAGLLDNVTEIATAEVGGTDFLITAAFNSDALAVFQVAGDGTLTLTDSVLNEDDVDLQLDGAAIVDTFTRDGRTFVYVAANSEDGLSVFELDAAGDLTSVQDIPFSAATISDIELMEYNGSAFAFVADTSNNELTAFEIGSDGTLAFRSFLDIGTDLEQLEALEVDGVQFLLGSAQDADAVIVFSLDEANQLVEVGRFADAVNLDGVEGLTLFQPGDRTFILGASNFGDAVSVVEIGVSDDPILGTMEGDRMVGMNGDDDLIGLRGADEIIGGNGDDVLSGRAGEDTLIGGAGDDVLVGALGRDVLEGGTGADVLIGGAGRDTIVYATSAEAVRINLATGRAEGGDATGDLFKEIESVEGSAGADILTGTDEANRLQGNAGADEIIGGRGNDTLLGNDGADVIEANRGADRVDGGRGDDTVSGGDGNDVLAGGENRDLLLGNAGRDRLEGGRGADDLRGGSGRDDLRGGKGADTLDGGTGDDTMAGGEDADTFVLRVGGGSDEITDFDVSEDVLDVSALDGIESLSDFQDAAFQVGDDTLLFIEGGPDAVLLVGLTEAAFSEDNFMF